MRKWMVCFGLTMVAMLGHSQTRSNFTSQGRFELSKERYTAAIELFNKSIQFNKFNSEAYFLRGIAKFELEDFIGAEKDLGQALELNPKSHEAFLYRGVCRSQQYNYKAAFEDFNEAIRLNDEDWRIYSNRALASLYLNRYVDVLSDCNRIIELKKENSYTYLLRGEAKAGLEMYNVAIEDFDRAIKKDSLAMEPVLHRGMAKTKLGQYEEAIADFELAMELDLNNSLPIFHRGVALSEMGKPKDALEYFNLVLRRYPENGVVLFNRAMVHTELGHTADALADYNRVVQLSPKNILGYYNRGILNHNQKKYIDALSDYDKAIELFPEFLEAHENRLGLLRTLGNEKKYNAAIAELEKLKLQISSSDEATKYEQRIKLMKATQLKGDFEHSQHSVGKVQHQKVDVRLLPFYQISAFPETEKNISVYDGFKKPFYNVGVLALATKMNTSRVKVLNLQLQLEKVVDKTAKQYVNLAVLHAELNQFDSAHNTITSCMNAYADQVACYFASGVIYQMQLTKAEEEHFDKVGGLPVTDTIFNKEIHLLKLNSEMAYRKVIELDPGMSFAHFNLGHILAASERYEEAETQFGKAASVDGNFIEANYNRGLIRIMLGKTSLGCEDLSLAGELGMTDAYNVINRFCE